MYVEEEDGTETATNITRTEMACSTVATNRRLHARRKVQLGYMGGGALRTGLSDDLD